jgi:hypothetical protein
METEKMSYEPMEIDRVPYMGLPDCKDCPEKRSTVIEQRLIESLRDGIICGDGDSKPLGLSRAEPPADG